jgi:hypothetical protein
MKMSEVNSNTWYKMEEISTDDLSINGIETAINKEFGEPFFEDVTKAIEEGYIQICDDGIIIWMS